MDNANRSSSGVGTESIAGRLSENQIRGTFMTKDSFGDFSKVAVYESLVNPATGERSGLIHIMNPYEEHSEVVSLPTRASQEDVEAIVKKISPTREFCAIITKLAECYQLGLPVIIEGGTATGKTFAVNKFTELLYGKGVKTLDFYCSGQTDVGDLIGKWVPADGASSEIKAKWTNFVETAYGKGRLSAIDAEVAKVGDALTSEGKAKMYQHRLAELAKEIGLSEESGFVFQYGAIPKAFTGEYKEGRFQVRDGAEGFICHVQEAGLAKPAVLNALLRIRGEQGALADSIQLWEDSGRVVPKGPKTFVVFTNNPVDGYLDRKPIDPALSRGVEWLRLGESISPESIKMTARKIFTYNLGNDQDPVNPNASFDLRKTPEIGRLIGEAMVAIHQTLATHFNQGESDDPQRNPVVIDNMYKVAQSLLNHQIETPRGGFDVGLSLERAITRTYLERARPEEREKLRVLIRDRIHGSTGRVNVNGKVAPLSVALNEMAEQNRSTAKRPEASESAAASLETVAESSAARSFMGKIGDLLK